MLENLIQVPTIREAPLFLSLESNSWSIAVAEMPLLSKTCSHDGCQKLVFSQDKFLLHDGSSNIVHKKKKAPIGMSCQTISVSKDGATTRTFKQCTHEGCNNIARKSGHCYSHRAERKVCDFDGCTFKAQKCGLCRKHFRAQEPAPLDIDHFAGDDDVLLEYTSEAFDETAKSYTS